MKKLSKIFITIAITTFSLSYVANAQVAINTDGSSPDSSAGLDVKFNNKGFLLPRLSAAEIAAISSPANGLQVYNTTVGELYIYDAALGSWNQIDFGMHSLSSDCGFPITDVRDGKTYNTVLIGSQCWMAENMNIGLRIDGQSDQTNNSSFEKYCHNDDTLNCDTYGGLYQWAEMVQYLNGASNTASWSPVPTGNVQGICPAGWHIPTDNELKTLEMYLGMSQSDADIIGLRGTDEGGKLKETGTVHWQSPNTGATNFSGFTAIAAGIRSKSGSFSHFGSNCFLWSSSEHLAANTWSRYLGSGNSKVYRRNHDKKYGFSVRCLKN